VFISTPRCHAFDVESHSSENSRTLIGYLGEVFSVELQPLESEALRDIALERQQNNNSKTIRK